MKSIIFRILFLFFLALFQLSFLNILLPSLPAPLLLLAAVVAWTLVSGFPKSLRMTVPLTLFFDCLTNGSVTALSLYGVGLAYATSFLSRRVILERQGIGLVLYGLFSAGGAVGYQIFGLLRLILPENFSRITDTLPPILFLPSQIFWTLLLAPPFFMGVYALVQRFENYLEQSLQRQFSEVK